MKNITRNNGVKVGDKYRVTLSIHYNIYADDLEEAEKIEEQTVPNILDMLPGLEKTIKKVGE